MNTSLFEFNDLTIFFFSKILWSGGLALAVRGLFNVRVVKVKLQYKDFKTDHSHFEFLQFAIKINSICKPTNEYIEKSLHENTLQLNEWVVLFKLLGLNEASMYHLNCLQHYHLYLRNIQRVENSVVYKHILFLTMDVQNYRKVHSILCI